MALLHNTFSISMQNIKICSWNYFNQIWCFKSSIIVNNMTYHLVLSGAFLLPKSIIGSKRQFQNHKRIVQLHRSTVKWKRGPGAVVSGAWPPCWRAVAAVSSALVQEHHTISAGLARRVLMLPTGANTAKSPGTHTHTAQQHQLWHTEGHADSQSRNDLINCGYNSALAHLKKGKHNWRVENANICSTLRANTNEY